MNDTLKWTLIGVGAYLLYQQYAANPAVIAAAPASSAPPAPTPTTTEPAATTPAAQAMAQTYLRTLQAVGPAAILKAANVPATQLYTASQWNYYLSAIGIPQPNLQAYGMDLTTAVPVGAWWSAVIQYYTAAANSPTGLGRIGAAKPAPPLIASTFDMNATGW